MRVASRNDFRRGGNSTGSVEKGLSQKFARLGSLALLLAIAAAFAPPLFAQSQNGSTALNPSYSELSAATRQAWRFGASDLPPDPRIRFGVLTNGMRYAILPNPNSPGASLRLHLGVGSLHEKPDEVGFAHLLEHTVFRGSTSNPGGRDYQLLQRRGVGRATGYNAFTQARDTVYHFDLPRSDAQSLDAAFRIMDGLTNELTIDPKTLEIEKQVVLEELRTKDPVSRSLFLKELGIFAPSTATAFRHLPREKSSIRAASAERLRRFYEHWYRPERTTLIVVGDIDAAAIETKIRTLFDDWRPMGAPPASVVAAIPSSYRNSGFHVVQQAQASTRIVIGVLRASPDADTVATRERHFLEHLGQEMLSRRLARRSQRSNSSILSGRAESYDYHQLGWIARVDLEVRNNDWRDVLRAAEQELRSAVTKGFTEKEVTEQLAFSRQALVERSRASNSNASLAEALVRAAAEGVVPTAQPAPGAIDDLASIRLEAVNKAFRDAWTRSNPSVLVVLDDAGLTRQEVRTVWEDSQRRPTEVWASNAPPIFAYQNFGTPGSVAEDRRLPALKVRAVRFANNVRLNILPTDNEPGRIRITLRVGRGLLDLPEEPQGLATLMSTVFTAAGTGRHSADELESIFAGRAVKGGLEVSGDAFDATRTTTDTDLRAQLAVLAAYVVDPGYRADAEQRWPRAAESYLPALSASSEGVMSRDIPRLLASGDRRFGIGTLDQMRRLNFATLRAAVEPSLKHGIIEIGIVGDVDEEKAIADVAATFGALAARQLVAQPTRREVRFARIREPVTLTHDGRAEDGRIGIYWPTSAREDPAREAEIELLAEVLRLALIDTLRERMGATYAPTVSWTRSPGVPEYQHLAVVVTAAPEATNQLLQTVDQVVERLKQEPLDVELLERARNPLLERLRQASQSNDQIVDLVARAQTNPAALSALLAREEAVRAITSAQLARAMRRHLDADAAVRVRIVPLSKR